MNYEEHFTQASCVNWMHRTYPYLGNLLYAVPNGQQRTAAQAAILKSEGMARGVSDICMDLPNGKYHSLRIEMKTKTGKMSKFQQQYAQRCSLVGICYCVARSFEDFTSVVENYIASVDQNVIKSLISLQSDLDKQDVQESINQSKKEATKAKEELHRMIKEGNPSSATEKARKELKAFLAKHTK